MATSQLSGANFYISCKQLFEAEKKIRTLNLMKSNTALEIILNMPSSADDSDMESSARIDLNLCNIQSDDVDFLDTVDQACIYHVSGYAGRSVCRQRRCDACKLLLVSLEVPDVEE